MFPRHVTIVYEFFETGSFRSFQVFWLLFQCDIRYHIIYLNFLSFEQRDLNILWRSSTDIYYLFWLHKTVIKISNKFTHRIVSLVRFAGLLLRTRIKPTLKGPFGVNADVMFTNWKYQPVSICTVINFPLIGRFIYKTRLIETNTPCQNNYSSFVKELIKVEISNNRTIKIKTKSEI